ncbi:MAG TPA: prolyl oligopeptidase family serine peptidase [Pseudonocardiaceae bacterium]|jgi:prolyl oligopeptidase|nr:prolyl oligopeptidase family serine peptidase [Pseudonocardiaceae bacterium]
MSDATIGTDGDPYRWLEDVTGEQALDWVRERDAETVAELTDTPRFAQLKAEIRDALDADDRIPYVNRRGEYLYNFWQDAAHPRGLWRRTTLAEYRTPQPAWEVLLDVDALAEREAENWVWKGAVVLRPGYRRGLLQLSRGGADAVVVREFDLVDKEFVADGFVVPEAKTRVRWIDIDTIYLGTDFGPDSLTTSGYPRIVKRWRRGSPLAEAVTVFEGKLSDVSVVGYRDLTEGFERNIITRSVTFFTSEFYLLTGEEPRRIEVPEDAEIDVHREWLLIQTRSRWLVGGHDYPAGALLGVRFDEFMAGGRDLVVLFEPDPHTSLDAFAWTRDHLILNLLTDVKSRLEVLTPAQGWSRAPLPGVPEFGSTDIIGSDEDGTEYLLDSSGYTEPSTLRRGEVGEPAEILKQAPAMFDADGLEVRQFFATSKDGTRIPYFVVGERGSSARPTLLTGYGGFEVSLKPGYSATVGRGWLALGGNYVVANIRGGGEYGPEWHTSVLKGNRLRVYEDFAAVAEDLVARGITTVSQLGTIGGSNGGLLMGVMLTRYPELFGAIVCQVPLLDMLRYHQLLAGASWMAEYGDPDIEAERSYLRSYSPYHNVHKGFPYPPILFTTSTRDDRVHPGHARKMVARMRDLGHPVRYYENTEGGHAAGADNEQRALTWALVLEFLWRQLAPESAQETTPARETA